MQRKVFQTLAPGRIVELFKLGSGEDDEPGIAIAKVVAGFFSFLGFPRLQGVDAIRRAIARGVATGDFAYVVGNPQLGANGRYEIDWSRIAFKRDVAEDEVDMDAGSLMMPSALPERDAPSSRPSEIREERASLLVPDERVHPTDPVPSVPIGSLQEIKFTADRDALFSAWNALANLADLAGNVTVSVAVNETAKLDEQKLENGVLEPLRELGLIDDEPSG